MNAQQTVTERELTPATPTDLAPANPVSMFERLASDPNVDVDKLQRLIDMQERILAHNAKAAFNTAFSDMQLEIPEITERGAIKNAAGQVQSRYARNEDIQKVLRPILKKHGFSLSFETAWPDPKTVRVIGILTHRDGHERRSEFLSAADTSGSKNAIQALGSAVSYGHRYTTIDLLNITSREQDDDGQGTSLAGAPEPPEGFDRWFTDLGAVVADGLVALKAAWEKSPAPFRAYVSKHRLSKWNDMKTRAAKVEKK